jgi:hypothetical protein
MPLRPAIEDRDIRSAQPPRSVGGIDCRIARADDGDAFRNRRGLGRLVPRDKLQRIDDITVVVARNTKTVCRPESHAQKQTIELPLEPLEILLRPNLRAVPKLARAGNLYSATPYVFNPPGSGLRSKTVT